MGIVKKVLLLVAVLTLFAINAAGVSAASTSPFGKIGIGFANLGSDVELVEYSVKVMPGIDIKSLSSEVEIVSYTLKVLSDSSRSSVSQRALVTVEVSLRSRDSSSLPSSMISTVSHKGKDYQVTLYRTSLTFADGWWYASYTGSFFE